jgi:hypothetical protein
VLAVGLAPHAAEPGRHADGAHLAIALVAVARQEPHKGLALLLAEFQRLLPAQVLRIGAEIAVAEPLREGRCSGRNPSAAAPNSILLISRIVVSKKTGGKSLPVFSQATCQALENKMMRNSAGEYS